MKIRLPITTFYRGAYRPPGFELDLPDDEARSLVERYGIAEDNIVLTKDEQAGLEVLNRGAVLHGGTGDG
jgi:hypothetical protein